ncbi:Sel1 repeat protein [compost metagenome]
MAWYRKAAEQGYAGAQTSLGMMYASGQGVPKDVKQAYAWFSVAAANGSGKAAEWRDAVAKELPPAALAAAQALAGRYFEQYPSKP